MNNALALPFNLSVGSLDAYMNTVNQLPKLSAAEEHVLAKRFREENDLDAARQLVMGEFAFCCICRARI